ncbi:HXXXD-type acyl-transferase family protein [Prunus dulcis]|uniref:HXXXD-type acyl-transferase family protein n=1 Tax=Prunus dulcis TaxID=3755 RepID=A0A4Y1QS96_PRUDU|nr:HXXXD-type acyl-transferase family protein [Prunus dulcis]
MIGFSATVALRAQFNEPHKERYSFKSTCRLPKRNLSLLNADRYISAVVVVVVVVASASSTSEESDYIDSFGSHVESDDDDHDEPWPPKL